MEQKCHTSQIIIKGDMGFFGGGDSVALTGPISLNCGPRHVFSSINFSYDQMSMPSFVKIGEGAAWECDDF